MLYPQRYSELNPTKPAGMPGGLKPSGSVRQNLVIIDVSDPRSAVEVAHVPIQDSAVAVAAEGNYAYVTGGPAGWPVSTLTSIDLAEPKSPKVVSKVELPDYPGGLAVRDGTVFVADGLDALRILRVTDPTSPLEIAAVTDIGVAACSSRSWRRNSA